ncbi:MAG: hypothetical protein GX682_06150 [Clostridiaceae bacterium]|nr:hypothetical protein [Clostridiaceae bacterium]
MENSKNKKINKSIIIVLLIITIIIQTLIYIKVGIDKSYIHMDEAYSLGLASYDKVEIQDNEDFYNTWHNKEYYEDYLAVNDDEMSNYSQVYTNQKNDVHPPLYYLLLRVAMSFSPNYFSKWTGIIINIIIFAFITIFMFLILNKLLEGKNNCEIKAIILAFISSITLASLTNVTYIRMYALATLNIIIITYLHIKLYEKYEKKTLILIGIVAFFGSLTHYHYLFFLGMLYMSTVLRFMVNRENERIKDYTIPLVIAGIVSIAIFPFSIQHMFFGYRGGGGLISNLMDVTKWPSTFKTITDYIGVIQEYVFHNMLFLFLLIAIGIFLYRKKKKIYSKIEVSKYFKIIYIPTIAYFILIAASAPYIELRYLMPICSLVYIGLIYWVSQLLENVVSSKITLIIMSILVLITTISPFLFKIEPQVTYSDKKEIVNKLENELNVPTIYWFNSNNNRFLDDILLFSKIDESYIAKDLECSSENINMILKNKETENGIVVFINEGQDNDTILERIKETVNLTSIRYLKRMNACDIYYIK